MTVILHDPQATLALLRRKRERERDRRMAKLDAEIQVRKQRDWMKRRAVAGAPVVVWSTVHG